jgi:hypothetical protein
MNTMTLIAVPEGGDALDVLATRYGAAFDRLARNFTSSSRRC